MMAGNIHQVASLKVGGDFKLREMLIETEREPGYVDDSSLQDLVREMLCRLGEDPERDGLRDTPARMARSMEYLTKGYQENPEETLLGGPL